MDSRVSVTGPSVPPVPAASVPEKFVEYSDAQEYPSPFVVSTSMSQMSLLLEQPTVVPNRTRSRAGRCMGTSRCKWAAHKAAAV